MHSATEDIRAAVATDSKRAASLLFFEYFFNLKKKENAAIELNSGRFFNSVSGREFGTM